MAEPSNPVSTRRPAWTTYTEEDALRDATLVSRMSPCMKSQRGVVVFRRDTGVVSRGFNGQPPPFTCDGSTACREACSRLCVHAEMAALMSLGRLLPVSRKGSIHRFYVRRAGDDGRWGLFIHRSVRSDEPEVFHNHPWSGLALILGSYVEETPDSAPRRVRILNVVGHRRSHRVEIDQPVWTVFLHFRRRGGGSWWFHDRVGKRLGAGGVPWRGPDESP